MNESNPQSPTPRPAGHDAPGAAHLAGAARKAALAGSLDALRARLQEHLPGIELGECVGRGGMGAVFRGHQRALDRAVAVKALLPPSGDAEQWLSRFQREARALARLQHPGIVTVHDHGHADDLAWLVMEFVDGTDLRALMEDGRLEPAEALAIVPPVCEALHYAHERGIVHRDVKPENILLDTDGRVRLVDFGLAKLSADAGSANLTRTDQAMGTPRYMAPEQLERPHEVDHRADIFSLGVVLYEMLTGQVPAGVIEPPSRKVAVDVRLDEVVIRSLQREPERRYQSASELETGVRGAGASPVPTPQHSDASERAAGREPGAPELALGLATLVPFATIALAVGRLAMPADALAAGSPSEFAATLSDAITPLVFGQLVMFPLMIFYIWHAATRARIEGVAERVLWGLFLFIAAPIVMPIYWYVHVWRSDRSFARPA